MSRDANGHERIADFQRMYCTVCLFLQWELFGIRNEKRSEATLFHLAHKGTSEGHKKGLKKPPKETPERSSGTLRRTPQRPPKPIVTRY